MKFNSFNVKLYFLTIIYAIITLEIVVCRVTNILEISSNSIEDQDDDDNSGEIGETGTARRENVVAKFSPDSESDSVEYDSELERRFNETEAEDEEIVRQARQMNPDYTPVQAGVGCGYLRMKPGQVVTVQSSNFRVGEYYNHEACIWKFFGHHCALTAQCPCADIPQSLSCLQDYLKITDTFLFNQRFCGDIKPSGAYQSATNNLKIRFRSDAKETAAGFICYVSCAAPGRAQFIVPNNITCPTSSLINSTTLMPGR